MTAFLAFAKVLVQLQKNTNLLLTYGGTTSINNTEFTLYNYGTEHNVTQINQIVTKSITSITVPVTNSNPGVGGKYSYWINSNDNKLYDVGGGGKATNGNFRITIDTGTSPNWVSEKYYSVQNGVGTLADDYYQSGGQILLINNGDTESTPDGYYYSTSTLFKYIKNSSTPPVDGYYYYNSSDIIIYDIICNII